MSLLALVPLIWIFSKINITNFSLLFSSISATIIIALFSISLTAQLVQSLRIWLLTNLYIPEIRFRDALSSQMISGLYAIVLPGSSQDIVRGALLTKKENYSYVWAATILGKSIGSFGLLFFALTGALILGRDSLSKNIYLLLTILTFFIVFISFLLFSKRFTRPLRKITSKIVPVKTMSFLMNIREAIYTYRHNKVALVVFVFLSLFMQLLVIVLSSTIFLAISGHYYFIESLLYIPIIELMSGLIAITPQGMGVREVQLIVLFDHLKLSKEQLGFYVLVLYSVSIIVRLLGIIPLVIRMKKK
jgi:uncharacterized protein (TIRG00374 family)